MDPWSDDCLYKIAHLRRGNAAVAADRSPCLKPERSPFAATTSPHDTAELAVQSIRTWLDRIGRPRYTSMRELMITADLRRV
jgi:hypothetical protein